MRKILIRYVKRLTVSKLLLVELKFYLHSMIILIRIYMTTMVNKFTRKSLFAQMVASTTKNNAWTMCKRIVML